MVCLLVWLDCYTLVKYIISFYSVPICNNARNFLSQSRQWKSLSNWTKWWPWEKQAIFFLFALINEFGTLITMSLMSYYCYGVWLISAGNACHLWFVCVKSGIVVIMFVSWNFCKCWCLTSVSSCCVQHTRAGASNQHLSWRSNILYSSCHTWSHTLCTSDWQHAGKWRPVLLSFFIFLCMDNL